MTLIFLILPFNRCFIQFFILIPFRVWIIFRKGYSLTWLLYLWLLFLYWSYYSFHLFLVIYFSVTYMLITHKMKLRTKIIEPTLKPNWLPLEIIPAYTEWMDLNGPFKRFLYCFCPIFCINCFEEINFSSGHTNLFLRISRRKNGTERIGTQIYRLVSGLFYELVSCVFWCTARPIAIHQNSITYATP